MEVTGPCFMLLMMGSPVINSDAGFNIVTKRLQYFQYDPVSFLCDRFNKSTELRVRVRCTTKSCKNKGFNFTIETAYPGDSGQYWCETAEGKRSNTVNITVNAGPVILVSPVLQVLEGINVTLNCTTKNSTNIPAIFYKDQLLRVNSSTSKTTFTVSKSDEGLYKCSVPGVGESPQSWLAVTADPVTLECPDLPLSEGIDVTLHCSKKRMPPKFKVNFYKDGRLLWSSSTRDLTIHSVTKSDEGFYKCSISEGGQSSESWLAVRAHHKDVCSGSFMQVFLVLRTVLTILMVALLLLLLGFLHYGKFKLIYERKSQHTKMQSGQSQEMQPK